ncbi:MAG TPA: glycosyltransferase [Gemmatimonadaceae bacterium]|nr:glycosyltransferase [Gemmatimonadaceae bacterium]
MQLISVITPVYNSERYVTTCIESVLNQTYRRWELIIVDDGSTDRTAELAARYSDSRIKYIGMPHRGISALAESYNTALESGSGSLVAVLEGDDFWPKNKLALQAEAFEDPNVQISWGNAIITDADGKPTRVWPYGRLRGTKTGLDALFRELTCANVLTPTVTVMVRRSALDAVGGFQQPAGALFVDLPTWLKIAALVPGKARRLDALLGYYRVHSQQISTQNYYSYQTSQAAVVADIVGQIPAEKLAQIGWSTDAQRRARARAKLATGVALLKQGEWRSARREVKSSLWRPDSPRTLARSLLALMSTFVMVDLVGVADEVRRRLAGLTLRFNR